MGTMRKVKRKQSKKIDKLSTANIEILEGVKDNITQLENDVPLFIERLEDFYNELDDKPAKREIEHFYTESQLLKANLTEEFPKIKDLYERLTKVKKYDIETNADLDLLMLSIGELITPYYDMYRDYHAWVNEQIVNENLQSPVETTKE